MKNHTPTEWDTEHYAPMPEKPLLYLHPKEKTRPPIADWINLDNRGVGPLVVWNHDTMPVRITSAENKLRATAKKYKLRVRICHGHDEILFRFHTLDAFAEYPELLPHRVSTQSWIGRAPAWDEMVDADDE